MWDDLYCSLRLWKSWLEWEKAYHGRMPRRYIRPGCSIAFLIMHIMLGRIEQILCMNLCFFWCSLCFNSNKWLLRDCCGTGGTWLQRDLREFTCWWKSPKVRFCFPQTQVLICFQGIMAKAYLVQSVLCVRNSNYKDCSYFLLVMSLSVFFFSPPPSDSFVHLAHHFLAVSLMLKKISLGTKVQNWINFKGQPKK